MSEDNATDPQDTDRASTPESVPENSVGVESSGRGKLRQIILLCLLGLMVLALAYDYRVARPNVEKAFDQIAKLNDEMNASATATPTLSTHIHKEIGRPPTRILPPTKTGPYRVEVFSWTAGLPFRTHDLYAVYIPNGNDLIFMRHYKFQLPEEELEPPTTSTGGDAGDDPESVEAGPPGMEGLDGERPRGEAPGGDGFGTDGPRGPDGEDGPDGEGRPGRGGEGRPRRPGSDSDAPDAGEGSPTPPDSDGETPPGTTPVEATPEATPSTPESSPEPAEEPTAEQPPAESDAPPAASETQEKPREAATGP